MAGDCLDPSPLVFRGRDTSARGAAAEPLVWRPSAHLTVPLPLRAARQPRTCPVSDSGSPWGFRGCARSLPLGGRGCGAGLTERPTGTLLPPRPPLESSSCGLWTLLPGAGPGCWVRVEPCCVNQLPGCAVGARACFPHLPATAVGLEAPWVQRRRPGLPGEFLVLSQDT